MTDKYIYVCDSQYFTGCEIVSVKELLVEYGSNGAVTMSMSELSPILGVILLMMAMAWVVSHLAGFIKYS